MPKDGKKEKKDKKEKKEKKGKEDDAEEEKKEKKSKKEKKEEKKEESEDVKMEDKKACTKGKGGDWWGLLWKFSAFMANPRAPKLDLYGGFYIPTTSLLSRDDYCRNIMEILYYNQSV